MQNVHINFSTLPDEGKFYLHAAPLFAERIKKIIEHAKPNLTLNKVITSIKELEELPTDKNLFVISIHPIDMDLDNSLEIHLLPITDNYFGFWKHSYFLEEWGSLNTPIDESFFIEHYVSDKILANIETNFPEYQRRNHFTEGHTFFGGYHIAYKEIDFVRRSLSNKRSRNLYGKLFCNNPIIIVEDFFDRLYETAEYVDYIKLPPNPTILNVGVERGTELARFSALTQGKMTVINVDPFGHDHLWDYVKEYLDFYKVDCREVRGALYNKNTKIGLPTIEFKEGWVPQAIGLNAKEMTPGDNPEDFDLICDAFTIENILEKEKITKLDYFKIDIEGGEEFVVPHLGNMIEKHRPQLAISIYHTIEHMYDLARQVIEQCPEYNFYVEHYSWIRTEVILYCIPKEIDNNTVEPCIFKA